MIEGSSDGDVKVAVLKLRVREKRRRKCAVAALTHDFELDGEAGLRDDPPLKARAPTYTAIKAHRSSSAPAAYPLLPLKLAAYALLYPLALSLTSTAAAWLTAAPSQRVAKLLAITTVALAYTLPIARSALHP